MTAIPLRKHQHELLDGIVQALSAPPGEEFPENGLRATLVSATGTGKTLVGIEAARKLVPRGRVLVMVPTLALLTQTVEAWREAGHDGPAIAVCSLGGDELLGELDVRCTTSAPQLALWGGSGPVAVFATYASLTPRTDEDGEPVPGPLEEAMAGMYGQQLAGFDLAIVDEAHRTSGAWAKPWAAVHDNARIPARRRLYMTATPRLWEIPGNSGGFTEDAVKTSGSGASETAERLVASMDDESLYGPHVTFGLMEAIERGILASFEIDVLEIRDSAAGEELPLEEARGRRLAALQAALLAHLDASGARSVISFHHRTREALAFARALPQTAAELHAEDPGRYPSSDRVWADWLCGEHGAAHRRRVLGQFADGVDAEGWVTDVAFLASCKVLGEGVDVRGRRGVDGVCFADTRGSVVDVVQNVGRGLRQAPGEGKVAHIIVPVFLQPGEDPQDMVASPSYRPLVAVLQGLRAHQGEAGLVEQLVLRREHSGRGEAEDVLVDDPEYVREWGEERGTADEVGGAPESGGLLKFSTPRGPATIARFLRTRVLQPESEVWLTGYQHLCRWVDEFGHARVPVDARVPVTDAGWGALGGTSAGGGRNGRGHSGSRGRSGAPAAGRGDAGSRAREDGWESSARKVDGRNRAEEHGLGGETATYPLGQWVAEQRRAHRDGKLHAWRFDLLDELGVAWDIHDARFAEKLAVFRRYYEAHGHMNPSPGEVFESVNIGDVIANLRKPHGLGKKPERAAERRARLGAIDPDWNPEWPVPWQRRWAKVRMCLDGGARLDDLLPGVVVDGEDVGAWLVEQRASWGALSAAQRGRLEALGVLAPEDVVGTAQGVPAGGGGAVVVPASASGWEKGVAALRQYQAREGHTKVPRKHTELLLIDHGSDGGGVAEEEVRLGVWRSNARSRRSKLTPEQQLEAEQLGLLV